MNVDHASGREPGRRGDGVRAAEADADAHAARGPLQRARHGRRLAGGATGSAAAGIARARPRLWQDWLPDIYLNPHGYPSHEWVQQFAGYVPPGFRTYLTTRGWYTSSARCAIRGIRITPTRSAALREAIVREINSNADVRDDEPAPSGSATASGLYGFAPYVLRAGDLQGHRDLLHRSGERASRAAAVAPASGARSAAAGGASMNAWPQVTFVSGGTEAPDETAQGDWLNLVTKPGFSYLMAHLRYLRDGRYTVEPSRGRGGPARQHELGRRCGSGP